MADTLLELVRLFHSGAPRLAFGRAFAASVGQGLAIDAPKLTVCAGVGKRCSMARNASGTVMADSSALG